MAPLPYVISVRGLDTERQSELEPWIIGRAPRGVVRLRADDVATLHGLLERLREMDTELLSVEQPDAPLDDR